MLAEVTYHEPSLSIRDFVGHSLMIEADCCDVSEHQSIQRNTVAVMDWTTGSEALIQVTAPDFWQKVSGQIVLLDAAGTQLKRSKLFVLSPRISVAPDLERFAFVGNPVHPTDVGQYGLYVTRFDDDQPILLSDLSGISRSLDPDVVLDWSPDGSNLLLSVNGSIRRLSLETTEWTDVAAGHSAAWSPVDNRIAYVNGDGDFVLLDLDSGEATIFDDHAVVGPIQWSPGGKYLFFLKRGGCFSLTGACSSVYRIQDGAWISLGSYGTTFPPPGWLEVPPGALERAR